MVDIDTVRSAWPYLDYPATLAPDLLGDRRGDLRRPVGLEVHAPPGPVALQPRERRPADRIRMAREGSVGHAPGRRRSPCAWKVGISARSST